MIALPAANRGREAGRKCSNQQSDKQPKQGMRHRLTSVVRCLLVAGKCVADPAVRFGRADPGTGGHRFGDVRFILG